MKKLFKHIASIGFTNRLAVYIVGLIAAGLVGGFYLALKSIQYNYSGALICFTAAFTPIGTACSIVLGRIVHKSEVENSSADGEGIKYALAMSEMAGEETIIENQEGYWDNPEDYYDGSEDYCDGSEF